jgi:AcrR family transcriptional regulator
MNKKSPARTKLPDISSEERIKIAAKKVFTRKGYAGTRTRDISDEAGMNLALLNYYYRSKEKLFQLVMEEKLQLLFGVISPIILDEESGLEEKIEKLAVQYLDMLLANPDLPLFVLSEIRQHPEKFKKKMKLEKLIRNSPLVTQLRQRRPDINPLHFLMNILALAVFPFIARPILFSSTGQNQAGFGAIMEERKVLIPKWVKAMLKA